MTNEELALEIKSGRAECTGELWQRVEAFVQNCANKFYLAKQERAQGLGQTIDDFMQVGFFALLSAVDAYSEDSEYKFLTYLGYHLRNQWRKLLGLHTIGARKQADMQMNAISLDEAVGQNKDGDDLLLEDIVEDPDAENSFRAIEDEDEHRQMKENIDIAIGHLDTRQADVIRRHYLESVPLSALAKEFRISGTMTAGLRDRALERLRADQTLAQYKFKDKKQELIERHSLGFSQGVFKSTGASIQELYVIRLERLEEEFGII
ncbi:MAG: sigma-70 family RNA polymerase sigma factor [Oscillospiraceae bacterium]|nr:sigma-70 family RNA polymerase sigma factor [Oscillospiraceae bacterium]